MPHNTSTEATTPEAGAFDSTLWRFWHHVAWGLPIALAALVALASSGTLVGGFFLLLSPLIVLVAGLLGSIPRWILSARHHDSAPSPTSALVIVYWVGLIALAFTFATLELAVPNPLEFIGDRGMVALTRAALFASVAAPIVLIVCAIVLKPGLEWVGWRHIGPIALVATPALLTVIALTQSQAPIRSGSDASAFTPEMAAQSSPAEARERHERQWAESQSVLADVRATTCPSSWHLLGGNGVRPYTGDSFTPDAYTMQLNWQCSVSITPEAFAEFIIPAAEAEGWVLADLGPEPNPSVTTYTDAEGRESEGRIAHFEGWITQGSLEPTSPSSTLDQLRDNRWAERSVLSLALEPGPDPDVLLLTLSLRSPEFWLESASIDWSAGVDRAEAERLIWGDPPTAFAANEWPELAPVMTLP